MRDGGGMPGRFPWRRAPQVQPQSQPQPQPLDAGDTSGRWGAVAGPAGRLVTWNLHGCVGLDNRRDPNRIARVLAALAPDVVGLQEVDLGTTPEDPCDPLRRIAEATGLAAVHGPTLWRDGVAYGNALLSRWPMAAALPLDLSVPGVEPRNALDVTLAHPAGPVRVIVTHLGLRRWERRNQTARLAARLRRPLAGTWGQDATHPLVLMGDLNEWWPGGGTAVARLAQGFARMWSQPSFPGRWPLVRLDRILVHPAPRHLASVDLPPAVAGLARLASDHRLVAVDLAFGGGAFPVSSPGRTC